MPFFCLSCGTRQVILWHSHSYIATQLYWLCQLYFSQSEKLWILSQPQLTAGEYHARSEYNSRSEYNFAKQNITHKKAPSKGCVFYEFKHSIQLFLAFQRLRFLLSLCRRRAPFCRLQQHWVQSLQTFQEVL